MKTSKTSVFFQEKVSAPGKDSLKKLNHCVPKKMVPIEKSKATHVNDWGLFVYEDEIKTFWYENIKKEDIPIVSEKDLVESDDLMFAMDL